MLNAVKKLYKKGFTLLELLVVVLIIGILAAIALPQYELVVMKSKYHTMMDLVNSISDAQQRYFLTNGAYSKDFSTLDIEMPAPKTNSTSSYMYDWGFCSINCNGSCGGCFLYANEGNISYEMYWGEQRYCNVHPSTKEIGHKVCKSVTNNNSYTINEKWDNATYLFK